MPKQNTKGKLLSAAVETFALKGYRDTTVLEICNKAGANVAAINYHFGSKVKIFQLSIQQAYKLAESKYPTQGTLSPDSPAEDRLRTFMEAIIKRNFDKGPAGYLDRILRYELIQDDGPHEIIRTEMQNLEKNKILEIISQLIGSVDPQILESVCMNIISLCVFPPRIVPIFNEAFPGGANSKLIQQFIDRQVAFALAGINALLNQDIKQA